MGIMEKIGDIIKLAQRYHRAEDVDNTLPSFYTSLTFPGCSCTHVYVQ